MLPFEKMHAFCNICIDTPSNKHIALNPILARDHSQLQLAEALRQLSAHCQQGCFPVTQRELGCQGS